MKMSESKTLFAAQASMIAAIYVVITLSGASFGFGNIQVRLSEALSVLPAFTPAAVPGLFTGCLLGNIICGAILPDIIFGSASTLIGAVFTYLLRDKNKFLAPLPPILSNAIIIPLILRFGYRIPLPLPFMMLTVGAGEFLSCGILGMILYAALDKYRDMIFKAR